MSRGISKKANAYTINEEAERAYYQAQKAKGRYQPGREFDQRRLEFFQQALAWEGKSLRHQAADLIRPTIKEWTDWPNKKKSASNNFASGRRS